MLFAFWSMTSRTKSFIKTSRSNTQKNDNLTCLHNFHSTFSLSLIFIILLLFYYVHFQTFIFHIFTRSYHDSASWNLGVRDLTGFPTLCLPFFIHTVSLKCLHPFQWLLISDIFWQLHNLFIYSWSHSLPQNVFIKLHTWPLHLDSNKQPKPFL